NYALNCNSLERLILPSASWYITHNVDWKIPSGRLGILKGYVIDPADLADWQALTASTKTLYINYIQSSGDVEILVTTINPKIKIGGLFATKTFKIKLSGTFVEKPMKVKVGGVFQ